MALYCETWTLTLRDQQKLEQHSIAQSTQQTAWEKRTTAEVREPTKVTYITSIQ